MQQPEDTAQDADVLRFIFFCAARGLAPPPIRTVSEFADACRVLGPEEGPYPGPWRTDRVPYMREPMDACSLSHPATRVTFLGSAQTAKTQLEINALCQYAVETPAPILVVVPSLDEARTWNKDKLQPAIDNSPAVRAAVFDITSRDESGSTTLRKVFPGGNIEIVGANSSKGVQSRTKRVVILDEVSEFPQDVDGRGDPVDMAEARTLAYRACREHKIIAVSTPKLKGSCRITRRYEEGSQATYHVPCPHCGEKQPLVFDNLRWTEGKPETARYVCAACGSLIEHADKRRMLAAGEWVHAVPERRLDHPSYRISALYSPFVTWADMVREYERLRNDPVGLKTWDTQWLGVAHEERFDLPSHVMLWQRRERLPPRRIPPGYLLLTGATDVQGDRLEWAVYAWDRHGGGVWIDGGMLEGDPSYDQVWHAHDALLAKRYTDAWGRDWPVRSWGIDAGYLPQRVYLYARRHAHRADPFVLALDGRPRWGLPPIGQHRAIDVDYQGRKIGSVLLYPVGTWDLKSEITAALRLTEIGPDATGAWPKGALRFPERLDVAFFEQITAEACRERPLRQGYVVREWVKVRPRNEQLDLAVYARALMHRETIGFTEAHWDALAADRSGDAATMVDLFAPPLARPAAPSPRPAAQQHRPAPRRPAHVAQNWIEPQTDWL